MPPQIKSQNLTPVSRDELIRLEMAEVKKRTAARKNDSVKIICDCREERSGIPNILKGLPNVQVEIDELQVGDYLVANEVAIERKNVADFAGSIKDSSLWDQLIRTKSTYQKAHFLLEGDLRFLRGWNP